MKFPFSSLLILFFTVSFCNFSLGQNNTDNPVTIRDHNGNLKPIVNCNYIFDKYNKITLTATYPDIKNSMDYEVGAIEYKPVNNFPGGETVEFAKDDKWSQIIPLDFSFCFYGSKYNSIILNDNGVLSFRTEWAGNDAPVNIAGSITSGTLNPDCIFGLYHDLTDRTGKVSYFTTGTAPFRKMVINYLDRSQIYCDDIAKSTFQIILYETTNVIEIYIKNKSFSCDEKKSKSLIGITGKDKKGISPENRDGGIWEAKLEAWRFSPLGENDKPIIIWYDSKDSNVEIGRGDSFQVRPSEKTTYLAKVVYVNTLCGTITFSGSIDINFTNEYPTAKAITKYECYDGISGVPIDFKTLVPEATEYKTGIKTYLCSDEQGLYVLEKWDYIINSNTTLYLRVENENNKNCFSVAPLTFKLARKPEYKGSNPFDHCIIEGTPPIINFGYTLIEVNPELVVEYYKSYEDAENSRNQLGEVRITGSSIDVYAKIYNRSYDCGTSIIPITFNIKFREKLDPVSYTKCMGFINEERDLDKDNPYSKDYEWSYYTTRGELITNFKNYLVNSNTIIIMKAKSTGCLIEVMMTYYKHQSTINHLIKYFCTSNDEEVIPLQEYFEEMIGDKDAELEGFYLDQSLTQKISNFDNFKVKDLPSSRKLYVQFTEKDSEGNECAFTREIVIEFINRSTLTSYNVCDIDNDKTENFYLHNLNELLSDQTIKLRPNIFYYASEADLINNKPITSPFITITKESDITIHVKVDYAGICIFTYEIVLHLANYDFAPTTNVRVPICDNNLDGKEKVNLRTYEGSLIGNPSRYKFKYYTTYENAYANLNAIPVLEEEKYSLSILPNKPTIIYVRVTDNSTCFSIAELSFENINSIEAIDIPTYLCDDDGSGYQEGIILSTYAEKMLKSDRSKVNISYHDTEEKANENPVNTIGGNPNNYSVNASITLVWIRFEDKDTQCYIVRKVTIILENPPKVNDAKQLVCDGDFDGIYIQNINDIEIKSQIITLRSDEDKLENYTLRFYEDPNANHEITENIENFKVQSLPDNPMSIYVKIANIISGCGGDRIGKLTLYTLDKIPLNTEAENSGIEFYVCDDDFDGITSFNLSLAAPRLLMHDIPNPQYKYYHTEEGAKTELEEDRITNPASYKNRTPNDQVFVRISSSDFCPSIGSINLEVLPVPVSPLPRTIKLCPEETLELNADTGDINDTYKWSAKDINNQSDTDSKITINKAGTYWATITGENGCSYTYHIEVTEYSQITTQLITGDDYITIEAESTDPLEYSIDNKNWQDSNTFKNLKPGIYTFYIRVKMAFCQPTTTKGIIFDIKNFITPNGDGHNDVWKICNLDLFDGETSHIKIFDRYGKTVFEEYSKTCFVWDGTHLGRPLPTTTYWYIIEIADGRKFTGWIVLKNYDKTN